MARIYIPLLSPTNFVEVNRTEIPQYVSRAMDDYWLEDRLTQWEQLPEGRWMQPWLKQDVITTQLQTNAGVPTLSIIDCHQRVIDTYPMTVKQMNVYNPSYFIYESNSALNILPSGIYFPIIDFGNPIQKSVVGDAFCLQDEWPGTLLIEYTHRNYRGNFIFETGITPSLRIKGFLKLKTASSEDTIYKNQEEDAEVVDSRPYRVFELIIGAVGGVPDWMLDKLNWIFGCSDVRIDGKYYSKNNENNKFEAQDSVGNGALQSYKIELLESIARNSKIYDTDLDTNEELVITLNSTSKGFADTSENGSSSIVQFLDVS